jgi:hypothetical protein
MVMMGVDRTASKSKAKATKSRTDKGVAGRNILSRQGQRLQDAARRGRDTRSLPTTTTTTLQASRLHARICCCRLGLGHAKLVRLVQDMCGAKTKSDRDCGPNPTPRCRSLIGHSGEWSGVVARRRLRTTTTLVPTSSLACFRSRSEDALCLNWRQSRGRSVAVEPVNRRHGPTQLRAERIATSTMGWPQGSKEGKWQSW